MAFIEGVAHLNSRCVLHRCTLNYLKWNKCKCINISTIAYEIASTQRKFAEMDALLMLKSFKLSYMGSKPLGHL